MRRGCVCIRHTEYNLLPLCRYRRWHSFGEPIFPRYGYINVRRGHFIGGNSCRVCRSGTRGWMRFTERWRSGAGESGALQLLAARRKGLREREGEVEALAEAPEGQEGVRGEVACGHLAVRLLVAARRTVAFKPADQQVDAGAAVLADSRSTAARAGRQLAALPWTWRDGWRRRKVERNED